MKLTTFCLVFLFLVGCKTTSNSSQLKDGLANNPEAIKKRIAAIVNDIESSGYVAADKLVGDELLSPKFTKIGNGDYDKIKQKRDTGWAIAQLDSSYVSFKKSGNIREASIDAKFEFQIIPSTKFDSFTLIFLAVGVDHASADFSKVKLILDQSNIEANYLGEQHELNIYSGLTQQRLKGRKSHFWLLKVPIPDASKPLVVKGSIVDLSIKDGTSMFSYDGRIRINRGYYHTSDSLP